MKLIRKLKARYYGVPFRKKVWYNYFAMILSTDWKDTEGIVCFHDDGRYIECPGWGKHVVYSVKGVLYAYRIVGFQNDNPDRDWLYPSDYINPVIEFVGKIK